MFSQHSDDDFTSHIPQSSYTYSKIYLQLGYIASPPGKQHPSMGIQPTKNDKKAMLMMQPVAPSINTKNTSNVQPHEWLSIEERT
jgi:hypothetical protein